MNTTDRRLLPCPFCGGPPISREDDARLQLFNIECQDCGATGPVPGLSDTGATWNSRTDTVEIRELMGLPPDDPQAPELCASCRFFEPTPDTDFGNCRWRPENVQKYAKDWCGQYEH